MQGIMDVAAGNCEVLSNAYMGALKLVEQLQECSWDEHILRCQVHGVMWSKVIWNNYPVLLQLICFLFVDVVDLSFLMMVCDPCSRSLLQLPQALLLGPRHLHCCNIVHQMDIRLHHWKKRNGDFYWLFQLDTDRGKSAQVLTSYQVARFLVVSYPW